MVEKKDILSKLEIEELVRLFYSKAMSDPIIGFFFTQISPINLDEHVEKITAFWSAILFGYDPLQESQGGRVIKRMLETHQSIDAKARIQTGHFTRWMHLFFISIDELYEGENADKLKKRAKKMTSSMSDALRVGRGESRVGVQGLQ